MGTVTELFSDADLVRMKRRVKYWRRALCALAAAALAVCLGLVACTDTENALRMELAAVAVSTAAGWIVIGCVIIAAAPARRELAHAEMLHREERRAVRGEVVLTDERFTIRKSVAVRRVEVRGEEDTSRLLVCESRAGALESLGTAVLYTCHGYVAAYEVTT